MDDKKILELWYNGAGDIYRKNHGWLSTNTSFWVELHDNFKGRLLGYIFKGIYLISAFIGLIVLGLFYKVPREYEGYNLILALRIICYIVALLSIYIAIKTLINAIKLYKAIKNNEDTDLIDSIRMRSIRTGIKRLIRKGIIYKDENDWNIKK